LGHWPGIGALSAWALALSIAIAAAGAGEALPPDQVAAKVNGVPITTQELTRSFQAHVQVPYAMVQDDPRAQEVLRQILDNLIDRELLLQEAKARKMSVPSQELDAELDQLVKRFPSKEAFDEALKAQNISLEALKKDMEGQMLRRRLMKQEVFDKVSVNPNDYQTFYQKNKDKYVEEEQVRARHILIKVPQGAEPADEQKLKTRAADALKRAKKGEDFAELARQFSEDGTKDKGGDLGFFRRGQMVAEFEDAAFALQPGQVSELVRTPFGYHIIKVEEHKPSRALSFEEAQEQVKEDVRREQIYARYQEYVAELRHKARIEILLP
jgi:peptidyl-prolyl cis-trans isomerase C